MKIRFCFVLLLSFAAIYPERLSAVHAEWGLKRFDVIGGSWDMIPGEKWEVKLSGSEVGVVYHLLCMSDKVPSFVEKCEGTGKALIFKVSEPGNYSVLAESSSCPPQWMNGSADFKCLPILDGAIKITAGTESVNLSPDGATVRIPFSVRHNDAQSSVRNLVACYNSGRNTLWNTAISLKVEFTNSHSGEFIIEREPNFSSTDISGTFYIDWTHGVKITVKQVSGGKILSYGLTGGGIKSVAESKTVCLENSQKNVVYKLYRKGEYVSENKGDARSLSFSVLKYGIYSVTGYAANRSPVAMSNRVEFKPAFLPFALSGSNTANTEGHLILAGSERGIEYKVFDNSGKELGSRLGTGFRIDFGYFPSGCYSVKGYIDGYSGMICKDFVHESSQGNMSCSDRFIKSIVCTASGSTLSSASNLETIAWLDGLGRTIAGITAKVSPDRKSDMVSSVVYGAYGSIDKAYLPYIQSSGKKYTPPVDASRWNVYGIEEAAYAYSRIETEHAPSGRVVSVTGPGAAWHKGKKSRDFGYLAGKEVSDIRIFTTDAGGKISSPGFYGAGMLHAVVSKDESGRAVRIYYDRSERMILREEIGGSTILATRYIYDRRGNLRWVLTPEISGNTTFSEDLLKSYAFYYAYDFFGKLIERRLPGCEPEYYAYDTRDRLVLTQTGNQRSENRLKYGYLTYDRLGRVVESGEVVLPSAGAGIHRQSSERVERALSSGNKTPLRYFKYDDYNPERGIRIFPFVPVAGFASSRYVVTTGFPTAGKNRILGTDRWLHITFYYDDNGRVIQKAEDNIQGGRTLTSMKYDFSGSLLSSRTEYGRGNGESDIVTSVYTYNHLGLPVKSETRLNDSPPGTISFEYDKLLRVSAVTYGSGPHALKERRTYDIRGALCGLESSVFGMKLRTTSPLKHGASRFDGSISEWECRLGNKKSMYGFDYDGFGRLQGATSYRPSGNSWVLDKRGYTEEGIRYDKNGNILNLIRRANGNIVDNLVYSYTGNRLSSLREKAPGGVSGDVYVRGVSESGGYAYDANGNMVKDMRRGLELRYNSLNLLDGVHIRNGRSIRYLRLSDGRKLGIRFSDGSPGYDYSGNMTYKVTKGKIERESLDFGGGCIASTGSGSYEVRYWLRDHLGSVRAVRTASGRIVEENAYYPFGLRQRRQDYAVSCNRYRYNGKEEQQTFGYLDYGFRMYDACLGRWHSSDPLSERDPGISGYAYVKNAPLRYRDILGLTYTGYGDVPPYKYRWTPDGYELEEVVVTAPYRRFDYSFPILGAMGYSGQSSALWRSLLAWDRYGESVSDLRSVYGNASPHTSYCIPNPQPPHPYAHTFTNKGVPNYTEQSFSQRGFQGSWTSAEGVGAAGGFFYEMHGKVFQDTKGQWYVYASSSAWAPAAEKQADVVTYYSSISVLTNGKPIDKLTGNLRVWNPNVPRIGQAKFTYIGNAYMPLPSTGNNICVEISITYNIYKWWNGHSFPNKPYIYRINF